MFLLSTTVIPLYGFWWELTYNVYPFVCTLLYGLLVLVLLFRRPAKQVIRFRAMLLVGAGFIFFSQLADSIAFLLYTYFESFAGFVLYRSETTVFLWQYLPMILFRLGVGLIAVWVLIHCVFFNRKPGEFVCGKCGYSAKGATTLTCTECGADFRDVGLLRG